MEKPPQAARLGEPTECRVFLTHKVEALDYSALLEYASKVHPIYLNSAFSDQPDWAASDGAARLAHLFEHYKFDPKKDYLALSGDILRVGMVCALIGSVYPTVCFLRYDKWARRYWPFHVDFKKGTNVIARG